MMDQTAPRLAAASRFGLKDVVTDLVPPRRMVAGFMSVAECEDLRTGSDHVTASRFGLEHICGASCATAAQ
jgi:hypothetical protein